MAFPPRPGMPYYPGYPGAPAPVDNTPLVFATKVRLMRLLPLEWRVNRAVSQCTGRSKGGVQIALAQRSMWQHVVVGAGVQGDCRRPAVWRAQVTRRKKGVAATRTSP